MGAYIADKTVRKMIETGLAPRKCGVVILGMTFKENCPDVRNSRVNDIVKTLREYGINPTIVDPWANREAARKEYGVELTALEDVRDADCVILAVAHREFQKLGVDGLKTLYGDRQTKILIDVKGMFDLNQLKKTDIRWWRL